jgi:hypothetical protein
MRPVPLPPSPCRELVGGIYFGQPRGFGVNDKGDRIGFNTDVYSEPEVLFTLRMPIDLGGSLAGFGTAVAWAVRVHITPALALADSPSLLHTLLSLRPTHAG